MTNPFVLELLRQLLRWLSVWLIAAGLPAPLAAVLEHPETAAITAGLISLALAETGWLIAKMRQWLAR